MAYTAHVPGRAAGIGADVLIRDDRGIPAAQLRLSAPVEHPEEAEDLLRGQGWRVTAAWTMTDQG